MMLHVSCAHATPSPLPPLLHCATLQPLGVCGSTEPEHHPVITHRAYGVDFIALIAPPVYRRHEEGLNYNRIIPDLIVGSCLQTAADVDHLADHESVSTIFCLQVRQRHRLEGMVWEEA
jgi:hypothetical protein